MRILSQFELAVEAKRSILRGSSNQDSSMLMWNLKVSFYSTRKKLSLIFLFLLTFRHGARNFLFWPRIDKIGQKMEKGSFLFCFRNVFGSWPFDLAAFSQPIKNFIIIVFLFKSANVPLSLGKAHLFSIQFLGAKAKIRIFLRETKCLLQELNPGLEFNYNRNKN